MKCLPYQSNNEVGLLVSVRDVAEAEDALSGGADVIDVKEPTRGSLGAADAETVAAVVAAVAGRAPMSFAAGELLDWSTDELRSHFVAIGDGATFCKFGLAGCESQHDWPQRWREAIALLPREAQPVAVVYADWQTADAPPPNEVLTHAQAADCAAVLVDTWNKDCGTLLDHWSCEVMAVFSEQVRAASLPLVLAGSLVEHQVSAAIQYQPTLLAVRGAACEGGRTGRISAQRVASLRGAIGSAFTLFMRRPSAWDDHVVSTAESRHTGVGRPCLVTSPWHCEPCDRNRSTQPPRIAPHGREFS